METMPFIITSSDTKLPEIAGVIINHKQANKARITFMSDLVKDKDIKDSIVHNPAGFLFTHISNTTDLISQGYTQIDLENGETVSLLPKTSNTQNIYVSPKGRILSLSDIDIIIESFGQEQFDNQVEKRTIPVDGKYTNDEGINSILLKNYVSLDNPLYTRNKREIHRHISLFLNNRLDDSIVALAIGGNNIKRYGLLNEAQLNSALKSKSKKPSKLLFLTDHFYG